MSCEYKIAFSDGYFSAVNKLQPSIQAKINQMLVKLMVNPDLPGLNLEKLKIVKDDSFRSIRVDQAYRVILSAQSNVLLLLWVDHHDDAYKWAQTHKCNINAETGAIQLYQTELSPQMLENKSQVEKNSLPGLFEILKDRQLMKLGVPEEQINHIRKIKTEKDLDALEGFLPDEAYEGLFLYCAGQRYEDILNERELKDTQDFNTSDYSAALERYQTLAKFSVVNGEKELEEVLSASLEKWRVFLHSSQRKLAYGDKNGAVRVLGGAGTGKTVVAMHRAKWLAANLVQDNQKILFTTFTKNLAQDIRDNLKTLCGESLLKRIEVVNLDQWVRYFLRKNDYDFEVVYDDEDLKELWKLACNEKPANLDFEPSFFKEEWDEIIQPQSISNLGEYKQAKRTGRGTRLSRREKMDIWTVFETYRNLLNSKGFKEVDDTYRDAADFISLNQTKFPYISIIVDEAQDMGSQAFKLLRAIVPEEANDLFIVGDAHQRIYGKNKVVLGQVGINIRGRSSKLKINYRTTDEIRQFATNILNNHVVDDLDGGVDDNVLYKSLTHGALPMLQHFNDNNEQVSFIAEYINNTKHALESICIVARTKTEISNIVTLLKEKGIETHQIKTSEATAPKDIVRIATIHRVKGLEFDSIILASCNDDLLPFKKALANKADELSLEDAEFQERALMFVALTRAKKEVIISSYGESSRFIKSLDNQT